ncbi:glycosyltransferase family 39 protein [Kiritimatiellaeota bacterium B1221]|nr:glycosyltransferase family 39 protein [Kiritimatiellaeota bacterium B1221]
MKLSRLIFVFGFLILFIGTWEETGITGKDEFWVTMRTPMEMMEDRSYWTLRLNEEVRLQKPPLIYWFMVVLYQTFGIELWVARLVGVLSGAGMAVLTAKLYQRLFHKPGFWAGITLLATAGVAVEGRRAMLDMPLGFFSLLSVYLAYAAWQDKKRAYYLASGVALAAATLSKGPQSLLFVLPPLLMGAYAIRPRPALKTLCLPGSLFLGAFLLLAIPWPLSMRILHADFIAELENQIVGNRLSQVSLKSPFNALGSALLLAFPWSFIMLTGLFLSFKKDESGKRNTKALWLSGWLMASILPFFFMRSFERYMIPILPCVSVLVVWTLGELRPLPRRMLMMISTYLLALVAIIIALFGLWFRLTFWSSFFTLGLVLWMLWKGCQKEQSFKPIAAAAWVFMFTLGIVYPKFGVNRIPEELPWTDLQNAPVGIYSKYSQPAMLSMRLQRSVDFPFEERLVQKGYHGYIFTTLDQFYDPKRVDTLHHALNSAQIPYEVVGQYPVFFSRRNWIKFTRPDATGEDWLEAFQKRDLGSLKSEIIYVKTGDLVDLKPK